MPARKVASMGNPILRKKAEPVPEAEISSEQIQDLIADMVETMDEYAGRGLAAPQISESLRIVVMLWDFDKTKEPYLQVLINPRLKFLTEDENAYWEGCLSVPGLIGKVSRPNRLQVEALDQDGKPVNFIAEGFAATVIQHECDHLDGILYVDRIKDISKDFAFTQEYQRYIAEGEED